MPQLGESVTEGTLARWLVRPGDRVRKYQPIAEVITDKVNAEIPAPEDGVVVSLEVTEGQTVPVGALIARMALAGEEVPQPAPAGAAAAPPAAVAAGAAPGAVGAAPAAGGAPGAPVAPAAGAAPGREAAARFSPAVLRLAREHGVDLSQVRGTGLGGRITRKDVEAYIAARAAARVEAPRTHAPVLGAPAMVPAAPAAAPANGVAAAPAQPAAPGAPGPVAAAAPAPAAAAPAAAPAAPPPAPVAPAAAATPVAPAAAPPGTEAIPVTPVRRRIAERMVQAKHEQPHAWTMVRADVTGLVRLRERIKDEFRRREGVDLTYLPFVVKAVAESLREHPLLNSTWAGDRIVVHRDIHINIAVALEDALVVPVIRHADRLTVAGLAHAIAGLVARARAGRLTLDDVQGGTFTVNNTGAFGSWLSAPILNYPQAAILSFEQITREPVVLENDAIAIRHMVNLCCSIDHRVLDGLAAGRFLQAVRRRLEAWQPGDVV